MFLKTGEYDKIFKIANHVYRTGRHVRGDDRRLTVAGIDLDFTANLKGTDPRGIIHTLFSPDWYVIWHPSRDHHKLTQCTKGYDAMVRDVTFIMLSGEIYE